VSLRCHCTDQAKGANCWNGKLRGDSTWEAVAAGRIPMARSASPLLGNSLDDSELTRSEKRAEIFIFCLALMPSFVESTEDDTSIVSSKRGADADCIVSPYLY
jgi:hypothetical protein